MSTEWTPLNLEELNEPQIATIRGVELSVLVSPYDVPAAVRGYYDRQLNRFVIEFRYIQEEPITEDWRDSTMAVFVGKNSGRLYRIQLDVHKLKAQQVTLQFLIQQMDRALEQLARNPQHRIRAGNYQLAKRVISERGEQLVGASLAQ
jgi:hypothetical protein